MQKKLFEINRIREFIVSQKFRYKVILKRGHKFKCLNIIAIYIYV